MKKKLKFFMHNSYKSLFALVILLTLFNVKVSAVGWPANFEGVMLQGFYWDSYKGTDNTKWTTLTSQADELSKYFKLIWIPNSARANGENGGGNGYMPIYWFTNHNCAFGTEAELKNMINTFKTKGTGFIEDVVVNHRVGVTNWYDFPSETWNGNTYQLTNGAICASDEMWKSGGQGCPYSRGNNDTGEDFDGARDLDHTNATVQSHVKDYCKFLIDDLGYVGFRLDMVKGYGGQYTKIYNQYSKPTYCVGEYWDGQYDAVAAWIEATGKESAAFDFPGKYAINEAFHSNDMTKLVWKANGTTDQPAGLIHFGYPQFAVTFVDNHDTYRDGSKFNGNVLAANAFILCSPGTPCVFYPHYSANKTAIQAMIDARNQVGIHNISQVRVLQTTRDCYMAEVTGSKGKLVVKVGSAMASPQGYSDSDIVTSGNGYCIWIKGGSSNPGGNQGGNTGGNTGEAFTVYFDNSSSNWTTPYIHYWGASESTWPGVAMTKVSGNVWSYTVPAGTTGLLFNAGNGDATKTDDFVAQANHIYTTAGDQGVYSGAGNGGNSGNQGGDHNTSFTVYFDNSSSNWATPYIHYWGVSESTWPGVAMTNVSGNVWSYTVPAGTTGLLFNAGNGDATKTDDFVAIANHIYTTAGDQGVYSGAGNGGNGGNQGGDLNTSFKVYFDNSSSNWTTPYIHYWGASESTWPGVAMTNVSGNVWSYTVPAGTTGLLFNAGNGDATKTDDFVALPNHIYNTSGDQGIYSGAGEGGSGGNNGGNTDGYKADKLYLLGNAEGTGWDEPLVGLPMTGENNVFTLKNVTFAAADPTAMCYFNLTDFVAPLWDDLNDGANRYGAAEEGEVLTVGTPGRIQGYLNQIDAMGCLSWSVAPGTYDLTANLNTKTITLYLPGQGGNEEDDPNQGGGETDDPNQGGGETDDPNAGVNGIFSDDDAPVFFNLQGIRIDNPTTGLYIKVTRNKREKVFIR